CPAAGPIHPFSCTRTPTLRESLDGAAAVLHGRLTRAAPPNPARPDVAGVTDFIIEKSIRTHPLLAGQKTITLDRYLPPDKNTPNVLLLVDVFKGKLDPYQGIPVKAGSDLPG